MSITIQSSYEGRRPKARGFVDDAEPPSYLSRTVDEAGVGFGRPVFRKTGTPHVSCLTSAGGFFGVAAIDRGAVSGRDFALLGSGGVDNDSYPPLSTVTVLMRGVIWVTAGSDVSRGDQAYVTPSSAFTAVAAGNTEIPGRFRDDAQAGGLVRLRLD